jgi:TetR/AcrR family transcriptional regulator
MAKKRAEDEIKAKDRILKAAIEEFVEYGYYGARTQRMADRAKVNKAMLHYYFTSKENIYEQVLQTVAGAIFERLSGLSDEPMEPREKMSRIIDVYIDVFTNYGEYMKLVLYEIMRGGDIFKKVIFSKAKHIVPTFMKINRYFKNEMKKGTIRKFSVLHLLISMISQIAPVYVGRQIIDKMGGVMGAGKFVSEALISERKKFVLDLIMNGIKK